MSLYSNIIHSKINKALLDFKVDQKYWLYDNLTGEDHDKFRSKPAPFIRKTIEIADILNLKTVVEIGSTRLSSTKQCIDYFDSCEKNAYDSPPCCCDGHATFFWARAGFEVYTVDIDINCINGVNWCYSNIGIEKPENLYLNIPKDGIDFLNTFDKKIDVLYLDGWDKGTPNYAENHLQAFLVARDKLSDLHLVLIDDTDFNTNDGGKDKLLSPFLVDCGYDLLFNGRQTLFINRV
jgi:hypothetical protein